MTITWLNTATLILRSGEETILLDPFVPYPGGEHPALPDEFLSYRKILLTHGHMDHAEILPGITRNRSKVRIWCAEDTAVSLRKKGVPARFLRKISPGVTFSIGEFTVKVKRGAHVAFDSHLVAATLLSSRMIKYRSNAVHAAAMIQKYPAGQVLCYEISDGAETVTILGSLALSPKETYQTHPDLLVLPYQGLTNPLPRALDIIQRIEPKAILADHWDNTFPPISNRVSLKPLCQALRGKSTTLKIPVPQYEYPVGNMDKSHCRNQYQL
jgi:L-ascorbate metabolism protein UlaG (beta-lactamase superfamily)